ncbi:MAG: lipopolysaccharide transport periplasmic protein LptA [Limnohabitans sp.]|nr:lipopolysaccharide transport periplasmic protein LptA [Limnohabitans sp.]
MNPVASLPIALFLLLGVGTVSAERADRDKPMRIEADRLKYDDAKRYSLFEGKAALTKGTLVLRGARIEISEKADGYKHATIVGEPGSRAFFRQKREGVEEFFEGEAVRIEYDGRTDRIELSERAEVRRFRGVALVDSFVGQRIVYENLNDLLYIDGQRPGANAPQGRVRATISPPERTESRP